MKIVTLVKQNARLVAIVAVSALVGGAMSSAVMAAIPDSAGVIHGCYDTNKGDLRIIDSSDTCKPNKETALSWNQTGPQGPQGPQGPAGSSSGDMYAHFAVDESGTQALDAAHSQGVTATIIPNPTSPTSFIYCLTTATQAKNIVVGNPSNGQFITVGLPGISTYDENIGSCPAGTNALLTINRHGNIWLTIQ